MILGAKNWFGCLLACLAAFTVTFFLRDRLPAKPRILPALYDEPVQEDTEAQPFGVAVDGVPYDVSPVRTYKLSGLIVTDHDSGSWLDISHKEWDDRLNVKDVSLIWGFNVREGEYEKVHFSHADWTGYYSWTGEVRFSAQHFSNNHLLVTKDKPFYRAVMDSRPGDQIALEGYLVNYDIPAKGFRRSTSTVRYDTGDGACEIVYLTGYRIIKEGNPEARAVHRFSGYGALFSGACFLLSVFFP